MMLLTDPPMAAAMVSTSQMSSIVWKLIISNVMPFPYYAGILR